MLHLPVPQWNVQAEFLSTCFGKQTGPWSNSPLLVCQAAVLGGRVNLPCPSEEWVRAAFPVVLISGLKPSEKYQQLKILMERFRNFPLPRWHFPSWGFRTFPSPLVSPLCLYHLQSTWPRLLAGWNLLQLHFSDPGAHPQTRSDFWGHSSANWLASKFILDQSNNITRKSLCAEAESSFPSSKASWNSNFTPNSGVLLQSN